MVPHTRRSGCVALLDPFSLRETPVELCTKGEIRGRAQPPKTSTFAYPQPLQRRIKYGATPTLVLSPSAKPDPENAQTMHHEIQECAATQDPDSRVPTTHTTTKRVRRHTPTLVGFLTPRNPHPKNPRTRPGRNTGVRTATQDLNPRVSPTPTTTNQVRRHTHFGGCIRQRTTKHRSAQPPKTPTLEYPQPIRRRNKYGATHLLWRIFSLRKTPVQRIHGQGPGEIQACAQPPKTLTLDYSQPIQRGDLKYGATHPPKRPMFNPSQGSRHSWCPGISGLWLRMKMWMPLPLATLHKELEGPHPSKLQSFSGINTVIIVPQGSRGVPRVFQPLLVSRGFYTRREVLNSPAGTPCNSLPQRLVNSALSFTWDQPWHFKLGQSSLPPVTPAITPKSQIKPIHTGVISSFPDTSEACTPQDVQPAATNSTNYGFSIDNFLIRLPNTQTSDMVYMVNFRIAKFWQDLWTQQHIPYHECKSLSP
ncbi:hypothetical protein BS47DRAFT_1360939 [Hydnum rufescens UP504]|uniref:Uncharacterized protein n=1 Tax=Hydnum rufescens UP504 TaxID=1448309 RepID=A0A9P6B387_9AGAM|nr:hypothetical protein BS47DRAFT_1360939 [Hydnum rufescens UP504]